jgi:hypothetical protein
MIVGSQMAVVFNCLVAVHGLCQSLPWLTHVAGDAPPLRVVAPDLVAKVPSEALCQVRHLCTRHGSVVGCMRFLHLPYGCVVLGCRNCRTRYELCQIVSRSCSRCLRLASGSTRCVVSALCVPLLLRQLCAAVSGVSVFRRKPSHSSSFPRSRLAATADHHPRRLVRGHW